MNTLETLIGNSLGIEDLRGLEAAKNLTTLKIQHNAISDLTPLANLADLRYLYLNDNQISDLTPLANLADLRYLYLDDNQISDLTPLANLAGLQILSFVNNQVSDLTPLANLINLFYLYFNSNQVSDLTPLINLSKLQRIYFDWNNVSDISPLTSLPSLKRVHARGNPLSETFLNEHREHIFNQRSVYVALSSFHPFMDTESPFSIDLVFLDDFAEWEQEIFHRIAKRWEAAIQTELPDYEFSSEWLVEFGEHSIKIPAGEQIDDLRIYVTKFSGLDPYLRGIVGRAGTLLLRSNSLPIIGCIEINDQYFSVRSEFLSTRSERHYLWFTGLHEMGHVLGIGTIWGNSGMLRGLSTDTHFAGPQAIAAFNQAGGTDYQGAKVPIEPDWSHWRDSVLYDELMAPISANGVLSAITLQALSDLGYSVDLSAADPYFLPPPIGAKPVADAVPFCSLEGLPAPVYVQD